MVIKTASPGVVVQEVDLTRGTSDAITENVACLAGPFAKGPVDQIIRISQEVEFVDTFGEPTDENYEYWFSVDNFLEYSGECYVVRVDDAMGGAQTMRNAHDGVDFDADGNEEVYYVKNEDDYRENFVTDAGIGSLPGKFIARNPGTWANGIAVAVIDRGADYQNTLDVNYRIDTNGNTSTGENFNQTLPSATNVGTYVKVAAEQETIIPPPSFGDVNVRLTTNFDVTIYTPFAGGTAVVASTGNIDLMVARDEFNNVTAASNSTENIDVSQPDTFGSADCVVATTTNIDLTSGGLLEVDGVTLTEDQRVLVKNQTDASENGVYLAKDADSWVRAGDASDGSQYTEGSIIKVTSGDSQSEKYQYVGASNPTVGTDDISFAVYNPLLVNGAPLTVGGFTVVHSTTALFWGQDDPSENGIWRMTGTGLSSGWARATGATVAANFTTGKIVENTTTGDYYEQTSADVVTLGTDAINFAGFTYTPDIDGVVIADGDRVLVKDNTDTTQNGIYVVDEDGAWSRAEDADSSDEFATAQGGKTIVVTSGTVGQGTYQYTGDASPTVGTDAITFASKNYLPAVDGVQLSGGERVLLSGQIDQTENGIYTVTAIGWGRSTDANDSTNFINGKTVRVLGGDNNPGDYQFTHDVDASGEFELGTDPVLFFSYTPLTLMGKGDRVVEYNADGVATGAFGIVMSYDNGVYKIINLAKDADGLDILFSEGNAISKDGGTTATGGITKVEVLGEQVVYGFGATDANGTPLDKNIVDTIFLPAGLTYEEGKVYGWPAPTATGKARTPVDGERVKSDLNTLYQWSSAREQWVVQYTPVSNEDLLFDGQILYQIDEADDWYQQQIAFDGIPWFRFAGRPGSSPNALDKGSGNDEMHLIVYDSTGDLTGSKGNTLENYYNVSKNSGALTPEGNRNYYIEVVNRTSTLIYANTDVDGPNLEDLNTAINALAPGQKFVSGRVSGYIDATSYVMNGGVDNMNATLGEIQAGYQKFIDENVEDLDYVLQGPSMYTEDDAVAKANFIISIAEAKKDCMSFVSPPRYAALEPLNAEVITDSVVEFADKLSSSSYAVFDSGYKYMYDRFNDKYRYVALNADIAGLLAATSFYNEPWYSPAGLQRGQIRNVVKLGYNPSKEQRDELFSARVNPVVSFAGEGTVLYGDKTALTYSSAFDRINVRKLFLILEREITKISRNVLFEFNDPVTRSMFKNNVAPFLRDVQSRRGLIDYLVVCDTSNNTPEVVDRNEFVADIYIKPNKSINFVTLNFIATKTGVTFAESVAMFRGAQV